ncbi:hypothetical protein SAMN05421823_103167 [Catalinimonas alkaloidigena]|uniref:Uncharacterized protein n=1 Tax=Catalinimonas alkaloidigena TaxID=1075417 RepID=A0A1G9DLA7_9BACT|nr:hypothetical protein [Catalinimonas alkaloidigena]SDK64600.1 hypothetical protein SAMN05421823_103167 [Catalinimonas alkaloidigena]
MAKRKPSKPKEDEKPRVHPDLEGFDININSLGEVTTSFDIDKINLFLNKHVDDKKLRDRNDVPGKDIEAEDEALHEEDDDELPPIDWENFEEDPD